MKLGSPQAVPVPLHSVVAVEVELFDPKQQQIAQLVPPPPEKNHWS